MKDNDTIDLKAIAQVLLEKIVWLIIVTIVAALIACFVTAVFITPKYTATVKLYSVLNTDDEAIVTSSDIQIRRNVVSLYLEALMTNDSMDKLSARLAEDGVVISSSTLRNVVNAVSSTSAGDVINVSAETESAELSYRICAMIADLAPSLVANTYNGCSIAVLDSPRMPINPSSPNVMRNTVIGAFAGLVLICGIIIVRFMFDNTIKDGESLERQSGLRFIAEIPDMGQDFKGSTAVHQVYVQAANTEKKR